MIYKEKNNDLNRFSGLNETIESLGAAWILNCHNVNWSEYFTDDINTLKMREEAFGDMMNLSSLVDVCRISAEKLETMQSLIKIKSEYSTNENMLYTIKEIEIYIDFVTNLYNGLDKIKDEIRSESFMGLYKAVTFEWNNDRFKALVDGTSKLSHDVANIRSITVGINLDSDMQPYEAGLLSVNDQYFRSGDLIDRFMRMERKNEMTTIAPIKVVSKSFNDKETVALNMAVTSALKKTVSSGLSKWRDMFKQYYALNVNKFLHLLGEFKFLLYGMEVVDSLRGHGLPVCIPTPAEKQKKDFQIKRIYNPQVASKIKEKDVKASVVYNDISFDEKGRIYIFTGPNRGGKSVMLGAIGIMQIMFQLGLPVAAENAVISPVDRVFTHFASTTNSNIGMGRFGEECKRLKDMFAELSEYSLVLMDETLSATDSFEAAVIGEEILAALSAYGCSGVFATHIHQLSQKADAINKLPTCVSHVDNLVAGIENGVRTYKVRRQAPDGRSYAKDIADKYGLSFKKLMELKN